MKRLVVVALFLVACSRPEAPPAGFRVGLLTPGSINDGGWNNIAWQGLQKIKTELGAQVSNQEVKSPAEIADGFRSYGKNGYDLAFGHGFEFQDAAMAAGKQFPKTVFITTSGSSVAPNVSPMVFELEQATYLLGIIAARESKSGKAGLVGGIKLPSIDSTFLAFKAGAKSVNPNFEVKEIYIGHFDARGAGHADADRRRLRLRLSPGQRGRPRRVPGLPGAPRALLRLEQESERHGPRRDRRLGRARRAVGVRLHGQARSRQAVQAARLLARDERRHRVAGMERQIETGARNGRRGGARGEGDPER